MSIHPTAIIDPSSYIGQGVEVGPYVVIGPHTTLGDGCRIASHVTIEHAELGPECVVYPGATLGLSPQHLGYKGEKTKLIVGRRCTFREGVTAHRGTLFDKGVTRIGDDGFFMAYCHIAHDCVVGNNVIIANSSQLAGHVQIGNKVFISSLAALHQFCRVGDGALISGGAMVSLDVAPFCIAQGDRAKLKGLNIVGLRRMGASRTSLKLLKECYRAIFLSGLSLQEALKQRALHEDDLYVKSFFDFFELPKRGFVRPSLLGDNSQDETA